MKTYTGTKTVKAEPMVLGCYKEKTGKDPYPGEDRPFHAPGYYVEYPDGYQSWCPADAFEAAYLPADTAVERVKLELAELDKRMTKLDSFISGDNFAKLDLPSRAMLIAQLNSMASYYNAAALRLAKMETELGGCYMLTFGQAIHLLRDGFALRREGWNGKGLMVFKQVPAHITKDIIPKMQSLPDEAKRLIQAHTDYIDYTAQCLIYNSITGRADSWTPSISDVFATDWELVTE